ncbi:HPr kinase/phosphatase C-terminal domain-containing protein [Altererythrobacter sp. KTW20L]|uniref:HPr kinase/phosphorylase n=1 Tax=Altererythrobacter sp. KTW20L TaxID=2942210 RepID=UPI0020C0F40D|nr:HPr kinase/phosphatase C-terminal domain-containing protein [Altererythrobacter sp. KTW20L]MCL6249575.1 HPr kinase/phosphatase C-terminal domain-containing protein [Altererythrobacter sp. KTW20L]
MSISHSASCVIIDGRAVLIEGPPGSGKSSLALALIDRGATLVGDDGVILEQRDGHLWASPPPAIAGLLEVRNVGLVEFPTADGPVGLVLRLDPAAPRYVEEADREVMLGAEVPVITLYPDSPALFLRAEWAVRKHASSDTAAR